MDISNIIKLECSSCSNYFYSLLSRGVTRNESDYYEVFSSRNSDALVFFKPTEEELCYFWSEQTEHKARKANPELDVRRTVLTERHFKGGDSHRYDSVLKSVRSSEIVARCIYCDSSEAKIRELIDGHEFLANGGQFKGLEGAD